MGDSVNTVLEFYINGCAILATSVFGILGEYFMYSSSAMHKIIQISISISMFLAKSKIISEKGFIDKGSSGVSTKIIPYNQIPTSLSWQQQPTLL